MASSMALMSSSMVGTRPVSSLLCICMEHSQSEYASETPQNDVRVSCRA